MRLVRMRGACGSWLWGRWRLLGLEKMELFGWVGWRDTTKGGHLFIDPMVSHKNHQMKGIVGQLFEANLLTGKPMA